MKEIENEDKIKADFYETKPEIKKAPKAKKAKSIEIVVKRINSVRIIGATKDGNGYSIPLSEKYKDVKVGDTIEM